MRQRKLGPQEIVAALNAFDAGVTVPEICNRWGISAATLYEWRRHYASMPPVTIARLQQLTHENAHLRRRLSGLELDCTILQEAVQYQSLSTQQRRELIRRLRKRLRISLARACRLIGMSRSLFAYCSLDSIDSL